MIDDFIFGFFIFLAIMGALFLCALIGLYIFVVNVISLVFLPVSRFGIFHELNEIDRKKEEAEL